MFRNFFRLFRKKTHNQSVKLTEELIETTEPDNLPVMVFESLSERIGRNYKNEFKLVKSWNKSCQAIYVIWLLEGEVNNGGFNQFYANSSGNFAKLIPEALELIGSKKFSDLVRRANLTYKSEYSRITKYQDGTIEGFSKSYENNPLTIFDDAFYELYQEENLMDLQVKYIQAHKADFVNG